jgi:hypothetical protein
MKNSFFSMIIAVIFLFVGLSTNAQIRIKTNNTRSNNKIVKINKSKNRVIVKNKKNRVRVKNNNTRVVLNKPNRPRVKVRKPTFNRPGYFWAQGYWEWNSFYGRYFWKQARWIKQKRNHYWVPGFWEVNLAGFFWVQGYWELQ